MLFNHILFNIKAIFGKKSINISKAYIFTKYTCNIVDDYIRLYHFTGKQVFYMSHIVLAAVWMRWRARKLKIQQFQCPCIVLFTNGIMKNIVVMQYPEIANHHIGCYHVSLIISSVIHLLPLFHFCMYLLSCHESSIRYTIRTFNIVLQQVWFQHVTIGKFYLNIKFQHIFHVVGFDAKSLYLLSHYKITLCILPKQKPPCVIIELSCIQKYMLSIAKTIALAYNISSVISSAYNKAASM